MFNLLKYYSETLGIKYLPINSNSDEQGGQRTAAAGNLWRDSLESLIDFSNIDTELLFVNHIKNTSEPSVFAEPHFALFEKMRNAMGLTNIRMKTLEYIGDSDVELFHGLLQMKIKLVIIFKSAPEQENLKDTKTFKFIETYSPAKLIENPELKKKAWSDLQVVMKHFNGESSN